MHFKNSERKNIEYFYINNFKGCIIEFNKNSYKKINKLIILNLKLLYPSRTQINDCINVLEESIKNEGKYIKKDKIILKNNNICGSFKFNINDTYLKKINEMILIDKATILIYKKILSRYFLLKMNKKINDYWLKKNHNQKINNKVKNKKIYIIDKYIDLKIIKIAFNHISIDNLPIDFTEWEIKSYNNILFVIKLINLIDNRICYGKYYDNLELFIYNIKLYKYKEINVKLLDHKEILSSIKNITKFENIKLDSLSLDKIQNIFPCYNEKFIDFSLNNDFNHIFDLEDSVSYYIKSKSRDKIVLLFNDQNFINKIKNKLIWIRINSISSTEFLKDMFEVIFNKNILKNIIGIIVPKVNNSKEIDYFFSILRSIEQNIWLLDSTFQRGRLLIQILIESAEGLHNLKKISKKKGIVSFISGLYDYKNSIGSWNILNQYPSLLYQKKKIIKICKKNNIIFVESITPILDFEKSFQDFLITYNINFNAKWSIYPSHIEANSYSKNLNMFFYKKDNKCYIDNLKFILNNLKILKFYKKIKNFNKIQKKIKNYLNNQNNKDLNDIINLLNKLNIKQNNKFYIDNYFNDLKLCNLILLKEKYLKNNEVLFKDNLDYRNLIRFIEPISLEIELNDIHKLENINYYNIDNFIIKINDYKNLNNLNNLNIIKNKKISIIY